MGVNYAGNLIVVCFVEVILSNKLDLLLDEASI